MGHTCKTHAGMAGGGVEQMHSRPTRHAECMLRAGVDKIIYDVISEFHGTCRARSALWLSTTHLAQILVVPQPIDELRVSPGIVDHREIASRYSLWRRCQAPVDTRRDIAQRCSVDSGMLQELFGLSKVTTSRRPGHRCLPMDLGIHPPRSHDRYMQVRVLAMQQFAHLDEH